MMRKDSSSVCDLDCLAPSLRAALATTHLKLPCNISHTEPHGAEITPAKVTSPGSGLGLSMVAAIADLHGARVRLCDNKPGLIVVVTFDALDPGVEL